MSTQSCAKGEFESTDEWGRSALGCALPREDHSRGSFTRNPLRLRSRTSMPIEKLDSRLTRRELRFKVLRHGVNVFRADFSHRVQNLRRSFIVFSGQRRFRICEQLVTERLVRQHTPDQLINA